MKSMVDWRTTGGKKKKADLEMNLIFDGEEERVESRMTHGLLTSENDEMSKKRSGTFQSKNSLVLLLFSLRRLRETEGRQSLPRLCFEFKY